MTTYDGVSLRYDPMGNPLTYYNGTQWNMVWENGRQLKAAMTGGKTLVFTYNDEGIRTTKTVNGVVHTYRLNGSQIIAEEWTTADDDGTTVEHMILFLYDAEGAPVGMQYRNQTYAPEIFDVYWFERNLQGDVVAVYDEDGDKLISYIYDAWGNFTTTYYNDCTTASTANYNPFRYRSYYYDAELEMYYLQSRYYDPAICRFINADDISCLSANGDFASYNLYAYCGNNPVSRKDDGGKFWHIVAGAALGGILAGVATAISCVANGDDLEKAVGKILVSTACGAIGGALAATGIGVAGQMIIGGVLGAAESAANQMIDTGSIDPVELGIATVSGVVGGFTGGNGAAHGKKFMTYHRKEFVKNMRSSGLDTAFTKYVKHTWNWTKQNLRTGTFTGVGLAFLGNKATSDRLKQVKYVMEVGYNWLTS